MIDEEVLQIFMPYIHGHCTLSGPKDLPHIIVISMRNMWKHWQLLAECHTISTGTGEHS